MASSRNTCSVLLGVCLTAVLIAAPAVAHGHKRSGDCLFRIDDAQTQVEDLADGVVVTLTSKDEATVSELQTIAWAQVEQDESERRHDCFFQMAGAQVLVQDLSDGVILTITATDEETAAELQERARQATRSGCRHKGRHGGRH